jgi:antirestriction protein ArdC
LDVLREDNRAIIRAASQASKAADYILGFLPQDKPDERDQPSHELTAV